MRTPTTMLAIMALVGLFLLHHPSAVEGAACDNRFPLKLNFLNMTTQAGNPSTCQDGTRATFFLDMPAASVVNPDWIIYFGDGETCNGEDCDKQCDLGFDSPDGVCRGISPDFNDAINSATGDELDMNVVKCYLARSECGSEFFTRLQTIAPQTILCRDNFPNHARVWLPQCTLDWFLGRGSVNNPSSPRFRGAFVVDQLFETLEQQYGISKAETVVLAGTRGGGVGALHSAKHIREKLNGPNVITLVDSAWFTDLEMFSPVSEKPQDVYVIDGKLRLDTQEWISFARMNEDCDLTWNIGGPSIAQRHRCMVVQELLPHLANEKILFIQNQYDLVFLSTFGLLDETAEQRFFDATSYAVGAISYVENFGAVNRASTMDAATTGPDNHYFFMPACGTHGLILPTNIHRVARQAQKIGDAGTIMFERSIRTWENIKVGGLSTDTAVRRWIESKGNAMITPEETASVESGGLTVGVVTDKCIGFLCNPTCTEEIFPFRVSSFFSPCAQYVILAYALLALFSLWMAFAWAYLNVKLFRTRARKYWTAFKTGMPLPDFGFEHRRDRVLGALEKNGGMDPYELEQLKFKPQEKPTVAAAAAAASPVVHQAVMTPPPGMKVADAPPPVAAAAAAAAPPPQQPEVEEEGGIDLVALAEALTSPDKATRLAAKKAYKEHQKQMEHRRKMQKKTQAERDYEIKKQEAKREFEERQAAAGLQAQQAAAAKRAEEEAKLLAKKKKGGAVTSDVGGEDTPVKEDNMMASMTSLTGGGGGSSVNLLAPTTTTAVRAGKTQKRAEEELLLEAACNDYRKVHLMVKDLSYWAPARKPKSLLQRLVRAKGTSANQPFQILRNVDLAVKPAQVHALMGPSGSGKSTLLDVLALIRDSGEMKGTHYINGVPSSHSNAKFLSDWLRNNVSYVRQTDVLFPRLTVREHLVHAAWLLLPQYMPDCKKLRRVQQVIELLELDACADTICGDGGVKIEGGISGGQRRRVSVATQLLRLPACLLLDEPTSGLDSTNALLLCKSLSTLAHRGGLTIVMTIHQPRNEIFALFDQLTILVAGRIVFSGTPLEAPKHFDIDRSDKSQQDLSVANAILDLLATAPEQIVMGFESRYADGELGKKMTQSMLSEITDFTPEMASDLQDVLRETALGEGRWSWESPSSAGMQMWVLLSRTMRRGGFDLKKSMLLAFVGGCVVGICFVGIGSITSRTALCYLGVATMTFLQGAFLGDRYLAEKQMYDHESTAGSAVQWTAFLASQFVRDAVTSASEALSFGIPVYWIGGMFPTADRFFIYLLMLILIAHVCVSSNVLVEIDRDNLRAAALVNAAYVGLGALFNGFIIRISDLPVYLSWLPYIMVTYWGFAGILINDFTGDLFGCEASVLECATRTGDVVLLQFSFQDLDPYVSILALLVMSIIFRSLAVFDFFMRYIRGRGKGMTVVKGGKALEYVASIANAGGSMQTMIANRGNAGKRMVENAKLQHEADSKRVQEATGKAGGGDAQQQIYEEWDQVKSGDKANVIQVAQKHRFLVNLFLNRGALILLVVVDIAILAWCCAFVVGDLITVFAFVGVNTAVAVLFLVQLMMSVCFLVPMTPKGPKDCTWAGFNDMVGLLLTVADFVLLIQLWTSKAFFPGQTRSSQAEGFFLFLIIAGLCRATRMVRAYNFWFKVGRFHELRAVSWLVFSEVEKDRKIAEIEARRLEAMNDTEKTVFDTTATAGGGAQPQEQRKTQTEANKHRTRKSIRVVDANPHWRSHVDTNGDAAALRAPTHIDPSSF